MTDAEHLMTEDSCLFNWFSVDLVAEGACSYSFYIFYHIEDVKAESMEIELLDELETGSLFI